MFAVPLLSQQCICIRSTMSGDGAVSGTSRKSPTRDMWVARGSKGNCHHDLLEYIMLYVWLMNCISNTVWIKVVFTSCNENFWTEIRIYEGGKSLSYTLGTGHIKSNFQPQDKCKRLGHKQKPIREIADNT